MKSFKVSSLIHINAKGILPFGNPNSRTNWIYDPIDQEETGQDFHSLALVDLNNDGDPDILSVDGYLHQTQGQGGPPLFLENTLISK